MHKTRDTILLYRERLVVYAIGAIIYLASAQYYESPVVMAVRPAISTWIIASVVINAWMSMVNAFRDPLPSLFGMPTRVLDVIFLVVGLVILAAATWYGSPDIGTWGCLFLLFALDGRLGECESWRRYRLKQERENAGAA